MKFFTNPVTWIVASMTFNALAAIAVAGVAWPTLRQQDQQIETLRAWRMNHARRLYESDDYAPLKAIRLGSTKSAVFIVEGV